MNLEQLIDELRHGILHDRSDQIAGDNPDYLWSASRMTRYINEAQRKLCREGLIIRDNTTPEVCQLQTVALQKIYPLHPSVVAVISAKGHHPDHADLARAGHAAFQTYHQPDTQFFNPSQLSFLPPGKIVAFGTDEGVMQDDNGSFGVVTFRVFPAPDPIHVEKIHLRVVRLPLCDLVKPTDVPEVPEDQHLDMLSWAAYLALRIVDHDIGDPERAAEFKAEFELVVARARKEAMRKMFTPSQWGFGRNGFSYERDYQ